MKSFLKRKRNSGQYAKDRMKLLLLSERMECSPQMINRLQNDLILAAGKYIHIDSDNVHITFRQSPPRLIASLPLQRSRTIS